MVETISSRLKAAMDLPQQSLKASLKRTKLIPSNCVPEQSSALYKYNKNPSFISVNLTMSGSQSDIIRHAKQQQPCPIAWRKTDRVLTEITGLADKDMKELS